MARRRPTTSSVSEGGGEGGEGDAAELSLDLVSGVVAGVDLPGTLLKRCVHEGIHAPASASLTGYDSQPLLCPAPPTQPTHPLHSRHRPHPPQCSVAAHDGGCFGLAFSRTGSLLASGGADKLVKLWEPHTGALSATLHGAFEGVNAVCFTCDAKLVLAAENKQVRGGRVQQCSAVAALVCPFVPPRASARRSSPLRPPSLLCPPPTAAAGGARVGGQQRAAAAVADGARWQSGGLGLRPGGSQRCGHLCRRPHDQGTGAGGAGGAGGRRPSGCWNWLALCLRATPFPLAPFPCPYRRCSCGAWSAATACAP